MNLWKPLINVIHRPDFIESILEQQSQFWLLGKSYRYLQGETLEYSHSLACLLLINLYLFMFMRGKNLNINWRRNLHIRIRLNTFWLYKLDFIIILRTRLSVCPWNQKVIYEVAKFEPWVIWDLYVRRYYVVCMAWWLWVELISRWTWLEINNDIFWLIISV